MKFLESLKRKTTVRRLVREYEALFYQDIPDNEFKDEVTELKVANLEELAAYYRVLKGWEIVPDKIPLAIPGLVRFGEPRHFSSEFEKLVVRLKADALGVKEIKAPFFAEYDVLLRPWLGTDDVTNIEELQ